MKVTLYVSRSLSRSLHGVLYEKSQNGKPLINIHKVEAISAMWKRLLEGLSDSCIQLSFWYLFRAGQHRLQLSVPSSGIEGLTKVDEFTLTKLLVGYCRYQSI